MKSLKRLGIDPLAVYGTLCVKCPVGDPSLADPACVSRLVEELAIVQPRIVVVMGEDALAVLNDLGLPLARPVEPAPGVRPAADALDRGARGPEHRRLARRGGGQARVLVGLQGARRVVRGLASLLAASRSALAYFLVAGALPDLGRAMARVLVAGLLGLGAVAAVVLSVSSLADECSRSRCCSMRHRVVLVGGMDTAGAPARGHAVRGGRRRGAWAALLGRALAAPAVALALPVFVARRRCLERGRRRRASRLADGARAGRPS